MCVHGVYLERCTRNIKHARRADRASQGLPDLFINAQSGLKGPQTRLAAHNRRARRLRTQATNDSISAFKASPCSRLCSSMLHRQLPGRRPAPAALLDHCEDLLLQINGKISLIFKHAQFALGLDADAARGGVGDAAVLEADAGIGDVDALPENTAAPIESIEAIGEATIVCTMSMS